MFAALAFVTDYAIIDRKMNKCNCPKCEATNNEVISDNTDNTQVTENQTYSYEDIAGHYSYNDNNGKQEFYFYEDGTMIYYYEENELNRGGFHDGSGGNRFEILNGNELYSLGGADWKYQRVSDEYFDSDQNAEKVANSEIIYGS